MGIINLNQNMKSTSILALTMASAHKLGWERKTNWFADDGYQQGEGQESKNFDQMFSKAYERDVKDAEASAAQKEIEYEKFKYAREEGKYPGMATVDRLDKLEQDGETISKAHG